MIKGVHTMFYSSQAHELRAFLRDKLGFPYTDVGQGWLIFDLPEAEMGVHPADAAHGSHAGTHNISFYCDDIQATVADLQRKGVEFTMAVEDHGYGLVTCFKMPGEVRAQLYQPRYTKRAAAKKPTARRMKPAVRQKPSGSRKKAVPRKAVKKTAARRRK